MAQAVRIMNWLVADTDSTWIVALADDDLLDPEFAEVLLDQSAGADVVYPWCRVTGSDWSPNRLFREDALRRQNFIPQCALIRRDLWERLGGWTPMEYEDWDFWKRALDIGARFRCVPEVLWTYRMEGQNLFNHGKG